MQRAQAQDPSDISWHIPWQQRPVVIEGVSPGQLSEQPGEVAVRLNPVGPAGLYERIKVGASVRPISL